MPTADRSVPPTDAQIKLRALSRWEGEGGKIGRAGVPEDVLDERELRILARIGAAALAAWDAFPTDQREGLLQAIWSPSVPGDLARAKARLAAFLRENGHR